MPDQTALEKWIQMKTGARPGEYDNSAVFEQAQKLGVQVDPTVLTGSRAAMSPKQQQAQEQFSAWLKMNASPKEAPTEGELDYFAQLAAKKEEEDARMNSLAPQGL